MHGRDWLLPERPELAELYSKLGNGSGSLAEFVRAADLLPNDGDTRVKVGSLLLAATTPATGRIRTSRGIRADAAVVECRHAIG